MQFDYAVASTQQGQPHFDFMVGTDTSTGAAWPSAYLIKGKEDPYIVSSILSWLSKLGHSKVIIQSDGEPASEVVMRMVQSKRRNDGKPTVRNHPTTVTAIQPPEQRRDKTDGTDYTQPDQSVQIPD